VTELAAITISDAGELKEMVPGDQPQAATPQTNPPAAENQSAPPVSTPPKTNNEMDKPATPPAADNAVQAPVAAAVTVAPASSTSRDSQ